MHTLLLSALSLLGGPASVSPCCSLEDTTMEEGKNPEVAALRARFRDIEARLKKVHTDWQAAYSKALDEWKASQAPDSTAPFIGPVNPLIERFREVDAIAAAGLPEAQLWCLRHYHSIAAPRAQAADIKSRALGILDNRAADHVELTHVISLRFQEGQLKAQVAANLLMIVEANANGREARATAAYVRALMPPSPRLTQAQANEHRRNAFYAIVDMYGTTKIGQRAAGQLFAEANLQVGMTAPDIVGRDMEGKPMKLSDFRGQVVVLTFWGFWSAPCRAALPHQESLAQRLKDQPFALVGVNSDPATAYAESKAKLSWPSFSDGGSGEGPIALSWGITSWPTTLVLDPKGNIRAKNPGAENLDATVDKLLGLK